MEMEKLEEKEGGGGGQKTQSSESSFLEEKVKIDPDSESESFLEEKLRLEEKSAPKDPEIELKLPPFVHSFSIANMFPEEAERFFCM